MFQTSNTTIYLEKYTLSHKLDCHNRYETPKGSHVINIIITIIFMSQNKS